MDKKKDYFFYDWGDGKIIEEIPLVDNAYDWEEKQIIPILNEFDIFETGTIKEEPRCNYFDKCSQELEFVRDVIYKYGSISFGNELTIGIIKMTKEEYEKLPEFD